MQTPRAFIDEALSTLERAVAEHGHPLRNVQLATVAPEGRPGLRTVVVRAFARLPNPVIEFHTDARAAKTREIAHARHVGIVAWSDPDRLQLRLDGAATLHRADDVARARWDKLSPNARATYGLRATPGQPIASPDDTDHLPPDQQFEQFTVVLVTIATADVLRLGNAGRQTRAFGTPNGAEAVWLAP